MWGTGLELFSLKFSELFLFPVSFLFSQGMYVWGGAAETKRRSYSLQTLFSELWPIISTYPSTLAFQTPKQGRDSHFLCSAQSHIFPEAMSPE